MAGLFDKIKEDVKKGIAEGIAVVKEGANILSGKVDELTAEGKRQYNIFDLKVKIQGQMTELGGMTYDALNSSKDPAADRKIKATFGKIKKLEDQLGKLEGSGEKKTASPKKAATKAKTAPKKTSPATAKKTIKKGVKKPSVKK